MTRKLENLYAVFPTIQCKRLCQEFLRANPSSKIGTWMVQTVCLGQERVAP